MRAFYTHILRTRSWRFTLLALAYTAGMTFTLWLSYQLRFDFLVPERLERGFLLSLGWMVGFKLLALFGFGQFEDSLSYFSTPDLKRILGACVLSSSIAVLVFECGGLAFAPSRGIILIDFVLSGAFFCCSRLGLRLWREGRLDPPQFASRKLLRVGIIGAGDTGTALARELLSKRLLGRTPIAFFDDFRRTNGRVHGIPVWGAPERLLDRKISSKFDEMIIALPSAPATRMRAVVKILQEAHVPFRTVPSMTQLATGRASLSNLRPVEIEDLLGRDVVKIGVENLRGMIEGRTLLVTGAGGSIGSELCRQIITFRPGRLLMAERSEAALFPIEQELIACGYGDIAVPLVADIMDLARMEEIFSNYRPETIFHAAAHKHVPMMETQPAEAIRNNVLGTVQVAELARRFDAERFLFISTDKAINPTSVMGATKRLAENFVQAMQTRPGTRTKFAAVRFGNVLGSSGSVVPIFARQIAAGGPVTVTHPDVTRYFMTIPEAVSLVLQSAARTQGGEIFILDMGEPVKVADLAKQMIELSGLRPHHDIEITFTGLRPGEKLYEELSGEAENITPTDHPKIHRLVCASLPYDYLAPALTKLGSVLPLTQPAGLKLLLKELIPEYTPENGADDAVLARGCTYAQEIALQAVSGGHSAQIPEFIRTHN